MQKISQMLLVSLLFLLAVSDCFAGQIKAFVGPFAVTGTANSAELKVTLQNLLISRLSNDAIVIVESGEAADISITGSYVGFGKVFSIDTVAKNSAGKVLIRAFEQGESPEEILPAVGKLAKVLATGIEKNYLNKEVLPVSLAAPPRAAPVAPSTDIVRAATANNQTGSGWISNKLKGELTGLALGRKLASGEREIFIAGRHSLQFYRLGKELTLVTEVTLPAYQKILTIDAADLDSDGTPEIYLTVMSGDDLASEVWVPEGNALKKIGEKLPYFFRALAFQGQRKLYAQQMGRDSDYYGDLYEVAKIGSLFSIKAPLKLPRGANIYNVSMLLSKEGKSSYVVLNPDGYLLVFDEKGKELWKSSDKYGGSENYFSREDLEGMKVTGSPQRKIFLEQRITVTKSGEIIVPKNDGFFSIGNSRSYTKNNVFAFAWNGIMLDELWHTKLSQNYLADYCYDDEQKELLLLEVVKKEGIIAQGASALSIKRVE